MSHYLAIDLGAESGRALLGSLSGGRLSVEELHRFPNTPVRVPGALYWDTLRLWHEIQHASFLLAGLLFWWPVIQPWPSSSRSPGWSVPLYLFLATLPCDALSAFLTFCGRVIYPSYVSVSHPLHISALQDQEWAGVLMWVSVTFIYMLPALVLTVRLLSPPKPKETRALRLRPSATSRLAQRGGM